jgi:glycerol-3-phosphate cytidylyltransferase
MKIGAIAGNFDVIHPGYIKMFQECKKNCDYFIILLHEDPSVERPKKLKPILSVEERIDILMSIRHIDDVIVYKTEDDLVKTLQSLKINVRFLGDDYINKEFTGKYLGIPIHYLDRSHGWSTTKFKNLIAQSIVP